MCWIPSSRFWTFSTTIPDASANTIQHNVVKCFQTHTHTYSCKKQPSLRIYYFLTLLSLSSISLCQLPQYILSIYSKIKQFTKSLFKPSTYVTIFYDINYFLLMYSCQLYSNQKHLPLSGHQPSLSPTLSPFIIHFQILYCYI